MSRLGTDFANLWLMVDIGARAGESEAGINSQFIRLYPRISREQVRGNYATKVSASSQKRDKALKSLRCPIATEKRPWFCSKANSPSTRDATRMSSIRKPS